MERPESLHRGPHCTRCQAHRLGASGTLVTLVTPTFVGRSQPVLGPASGAREIARVAGGVRWRLWGLAHGRAPIWCPVKAGLPSSPYVR